MKFLGMGVNWSFIYTLKKAINWQILKLKGSINYNHNLYLIEQKVFHVQTTLLELIILLKDTRLNMLLRYACLYINKSGMVATLGLNFCTLTVWLEDLTGLSYIDRQMTWKLLPTFSTTLRQLLLCWPQTSEFGVIVWLVAFDNLVYWGSLSSLPFLINLYYYLHFTHKVLLDCSHLCCYQNFGCCLFVEWQWSTAICAWFWWVPYSPRWCHKFYHNLDREHSKCNNHLDFCHDSLEARSIVVSDSS